MGKRNRNGREDGEGRMNRRLFCNTFYVVIQAICFGVFVEIKNLRRDVIRL